MESGSTAISLAIVPDINYVRIAHSGFNYKKLLHTVM